MTSHPFSLLTDHDIYLFKEGRHFELYKKLGSHLCEKEGKKGVSFAVWAPNAEQVHVIGNFNGWNSFSHPLHVRWDSSGIWEGFIEGIGEGEIYKYRIIPHGGAPIEKGDPFAFMWEDPPKTASVVWDLSFLWDDQSWMKNRGEKDPYKSPMSIYEIHLGSWRRNWDGYSLSYRELAAQLPKYVKELGFTHVEMMPVMEHPFFGSWGYQKVGYFAPSSRFGSPQDFMYLVQELHKEGIGVILDWVPSHFPTDSHGLGLFDGTHLYEHENPQKGFHPDWHSYVFNYGRHEVRSFLISSASFWIDVYKADGLRVDAVSSMLYLDYSRKEGEWIPNEYGGKENIEALSFIREMNGHLYGKFPHIMMIAEESTAWPMVSKPIHIGGLGFGFKWDMGWMHDTLRYFSKTPIHRKYHHSELLFNMYYFYNENFLLSLSHDEVVHGKGSLLSKMPGDMWQQFANLRLLFSYMMTHPGKKLLFMGGEIGQWTEWNHDGSLDWNLLDYPLHRGIFDLLKDLHILYKSHPALYERDFEYDGFEWVSLHDSENSVIAYLRKSHDEQILVFCNFTPVPRHDYRVGLHLQGCWKQILNSDETKYGGTGHYLAQEAIFTENGYEGTHLTVTIPPLGAILFKKVP